MKSTSKRIGRAVQTSNLKGKGLRHRFTDRPWIEYITQGPQDDPYLALGREVGAWFSYLIRPEFLGGIEK